VLEVRPVFIVFHLVPFLNLGFCTSFDISLRSGGTGSIKGVGKKREAKERDPKEKEGSPS